MASSDLFNDYRLTGILLIFSFISFAIGATLPLLGKQGNMRIFTLPVPDYLRAVADNAIVWRRGNMFMGAAAVILLAGLSLLSMMLEGANERIFSLLGLVGFLLAAVLWVIFSAFRSTVTVEAAQDLTTTGVMPAHYEPLAKWGFALFLVYAVVGFLALAAYGLSILQTGLLPAWTGWATLIFSIAMLILLLITGDTLPAFHYLPAVLIGIVLLFVGRAG